MPSKWAPLTAYPPHLFNCPFCKRVYGSVMARFYCQCGFTISDSSDFFWHIWVSRRKTEREWYDQFRPAIKKILKEK